MSIKKITQKEILENGVKSLPTRPSTPSLYKGKLLSAEELKAAFDKLPTLIAERFNTLLASTGLFDEEDPKDAFAELIATELAPSHSLKNFFEDVKSGNLALYLAADAEGTPLFDLLAELKQLIDDKKSYTVSIEGDGDLLTDANFENDALTLVRGTSRESILAEAKAYTDNPTGAVESSCTAPVSGESVHLAIEKVSAEQSRRIKNLENAAKDILYTYPEETESFACKQIDSNVLSNTALLKMGASPAKQHNFLPAQFISTVETDTYSITLDDFTGEIVINGTIPGDIFIPLGSFRLSPKHTRYFLKSFHCGGSFDAEDVLIYAYDCQGASNCLFFSNENDVCYLDIPADNPIMILELNTLSETVFNDYRLHLMISTEETGDYTPFSADFRFSLPKGIRAQGPNLWQGEKRLVGEEYVSFIPPQIPGIYDYSIGFSHQTTLNTKTSVTLAHIYTEDGLFCTKIYSKNDFKALSVTVNKPITEVRIYAAKTPELSIGETITIQDIYVEALRLPKSGATIYTDPGYDEILFPESFSRFSTKYIGFGDENCNYFDFERDAFIEKIKLLTIDGTLDFEADPSVPNCFSAPFPVPSALQSEKAVYLPAFPFSAATDDIGEDKLWFTADRVFLQGTHFAGKSAADVQNFFHRVPIDVAYVDEANYTVTILTEEEIAFYDRIPTIRTDPCAYLYFFDENGDPIETYSHMQYQVKEASL